MVINVDVVFIINLIFTALILRTVDMLWGSRAKMGRIFVASFFSSVYLLLLLILQGGILVFLLTHPILSLFMVFMVWGYGYWGRFLKYFFSLYGVAFFVGGLAMSFWNLTRGQGKLQILILVCIFFLVIVLANRGWGLFTRWQENKNIYSIRIRLAGEIRGFQAFLDTGNQLWVRGKIPVIIVAWPEIKEMLGGEAEKPYDLFVLESDLGQSNLQIIFFQSIGLDQGSMVVIEPQWVQVLVDGNYYYLKKVFLGLYEGELPAGVRALLPADLKKILSCGHEIDIS